VVNQAALHSLLKTLRDLGAPVIYVDRIEANETHLNYLKKEKN